LLQPQIPDIEGLHAWPDLCLLPFDNQDQAWFVVSVLHEVHLDFGLQGGRETAGSAENSADLYQIEQYSNGSWSKISENWNFGKALSARL